LISLLGSPPTCDIQYVDRTTLSPTLSHGLNPSPRHHLTTHWQPRRRATTNFEHFWHRAPPCSLSGNKFPAPRPPSTATHRPGSPRPYVPVSLLLQVLQSVRDLSHPGTGTAKLVAQRFVWPGIQKDCRTWGRVCEACQRSKDCRHTVTSSGRVYAAGSPLSSPYRPRGAPSNVSRLHILPHCS
jgi:hypothetical protein